MARQLKDWLRAYIKYTEMSESPEVFHFWTGVSTIAGALRRRVWIDQTFFEWVPNFYIIFVAPAGVVSKSTTIRYGTRLLKEIDGIHFGPESATWQALGMALENAQEAIPLEPGNLNGEMEHMACITCVVPELGSFLDFQDRKLIDILTALWDGQRESFEHSTRSQGKIHIQNPWVNIIGATTPAWLKQNVPDAAIGAGFASRIVFVFAQQKRHLVAYPGLSTNRDNQSALQDKLIHDLREMASLVGPMELTPEAYLWGDTWYQHHWKTRPIHMASERFSGYIARKQTHIHKLAMVLSVAKRNDLIIDVEELQTAEKITTAMEQDMINVFESIGVASTSKLLQDLMQFIYTYQKQNMPVNEQLLWRHAMNIMKEQEFHEAINAGVRAGYIKLLSVGGDTVYQVTRPMVEQENSNGKPTAADGS